MQACPACPLESGNAAGCDQPTLGCHATVLWHVLHVVAKPAWVWLGFVLAVNRLWWHVLHAVERPV